MAAEARFAAMGTTVHVIVVGGAENVLLDGARQRIAELERRWSRFLPESEISYLNAHSGGTPIVVSADTAILVERARRAWELTDGLYDPTVLGALRTLGYDRDFAEVRTRPDDLRLIVLRNAPGCDGIIVDRTASSVTLPRDVEIDPGGLGKGLAADLVTAELLAAGARGALVNLGGDVRVRGDAPGGTSWSVAVEHPTDPARTIVELGITDAAIATSTSARRRWIRGGRERHHLVDPRTGDSADSPLVSVTVVADDGWWAETAAKAIFVAGTSARCVTLPGVHVATVDAAGAVEHTPEIQALVA